MSGFPWGILFRERFAAFCLAPIVGRESVLFQIKFLHLPRNRNRLYVTLSQCQDKSWVEHLVPTSRQVSRHSNHILSRGVVRRSLSRSRGRPGIGLRFAPFGACYRRQGRRQFGRQGLSHSFPTLSDTSRRSLPSQGHTLWCRAGRRFVRCLDDVAALAPAVFSPGR